MLIIVGTIMSDLVAKVEAAAVTMYMKSCDYDDNSGFSDASEFWLEFTYAKKEYIRLKELLDARTTR